MVFHLICFQCSEEVFSDIVFNEVVFSVIGFFNVVFSVIHVYSISTGESLSDHVISKREIKWFTCWQVF